MIRLGYCILLIALPLQQANPDTKESSDSTAKEEAPIEEIQVFAAKPASQIRREIQKVDSKIYSMFNELNDDDGFDIVCRRRAPIGSQIPIKSCKARLYWQALSEATEDDDGGLDLRSVVSNKSDYAAELREKMFQLATENTALMNVLVKRRELVKQLESSKLDSK